MVAKIDELLVRVQQGASTPASSSAKSPESSPIKKISKPKPSLEPNMDLLHHEAQDLVQDVVMSSVDVAIEGADDEGVIPGQDQGRGGR